MPATAAVAAADGAQGPRGAPAQAGQTSAMRSGWIVNWLRWPRRPHRQCRRRVLQIRVRSIHAVCIVELTTVKAPYRSDSVLDSALSFASRTGARSVTTGEVAPATKIGHDTHTPSAGVRQSSAPTKPFKRMRGISMTADHASGRRCHRIRAVAGIGLPITHRRHAGAPAAPARPSSHPLTRRLFCSGTTNAQGSVVRRISRAVPIASRTLDTTWAARALAPSSAAFASSSSTWARTMPS